MRAIPTVYPGAKDIFNIPSVPGTTNLSDPGTATRNHPQHHQDLGDAVMALENNAALLTHDHSGGTGGFTTSRLIQANTHQSVDTDSATASLHHTIGPGTTQAAQGSLVASHTGTLNSIYATQYGASNRTGPPWCDIRYTAGSTFNVPSSVETWAQGGWSATGGGADPDGMLGASGGYQWINIPIAGRYRIHFHVSAVLPGSLGTTAFARMTGPSGPNATYAVGQNITHVAQANEFYLESFRERYFAAGDHILWTIWTYPADITVRSDGGAFNLPTFVYVRYISPT